MSMHEALKGIGIPCSLRMNSFSVRIRGVSLDENAGVAEQADAMDSKSIVRKDIQVRFLSPVLNRK